MLLEQYPIISAYLSEIQEARSSKCHLAVVLLIGGVCELILREIAKDEWMGMEKLIAVAQENELISAEQAVLFEEIRNRRNKYLHINAEKILQDHGHYTVGEDGLLDDVNEIALSDFTEENFSKTLAAHIEADAELISDNFKKLTELLSKT